MSTSLPPVSLFTKLFDDAAVFPPSSHSLRDALARRKERTTTADAQFVGPLLLPPPLVAAALGQPEPLLITVVGRAGSPLADVVAAATAVAEHSWHSLASIQFAYTDSWRDALHLGTPVAVEVPHGAEGITLLDQLAEQAETQQVRAKLRTGSTPTTPVPSPAQLAAFISGCISRDLSFKLTGGMHHAITYDASQEQQFGFLNVLNATATLLEGDTEGGAALLLDERRASDVVDRIRTIDGEHASGIRDVFQSYGCCDPQDPITDLRTLGLLPESAA